MATERNTLNHKLVLLGDSGVGKSCLVVRFVRDEFFEFQEPTIGGALPSLLPRQRCAQTLTAVALLCFDVLTVCTFPLFWFTTAAFLTKNVPLDDTTIKFEIWDTAGQGVCCRACWNCA